MEHQTLKQSYRFCQQQLASCGLHHFLEPYEHIAAVEALRQQYRPTQVKVLVIAESHVRRSIAQFSASGPAFLYNSRYYTPWWRHLLSPAYGFAGKTTPTIREASLRELQHRGFWVLDGSILALSGYRKVELGWPNRPFDSVRIMLMKNCWRLHVKAQFEAAMSQAHPPAVVALENVKASLPDLGALPVTTLRFPERANATLYQNPEYAFGMAAFCRVVQQRDEARLSLHH